MINGISFPIFLPYVEQSMTVASVISPQMIAAQGDAAMMLLPSDAGRLTSPFCRSLIALPASDRPMIATVGPITTGGISLLSQRTPTLLMMTAITT